MFKDGLFTYNYSIIIFFILNVFSVYKSRYYKDCRQLESCQILTFKSKKFIICNVDFRPGSKKSKFDINLTSDIKIRNSPNFLFNIP